MGDSPAPSHPPSRRARAAWYAAAAAVALLLPLIGYRLDQTSLAAPFLYDDDALLILPMVQATLEHGTHWHTDRLGAPGVQHMHDFPVVDHFHFALLWLIGQAVPDAATLFNVYYLLTYPLAALAAMAVLRHFELSLPAAAVGGVLYAMQPYHYFRGENHYFLSAYYVVPVTTMVILWVARGRLPFFPAGGGRNATEGVPYGAPADGVPPTAVGNALRGVPAAPPPRPFRLRDRDTLFATAVAVVTASAGAYYAFFACALLAAAGLYAWVAERTWRAVASAALLIGVIFAAGVANHAPAFPYQYKYGRHTAPTVRLSEESEYYGLKVAQLLLPIEDHSLRVLSDLKATYNSYNRPAQSDTERYSLGAVGAVGFLILVAHTFLPVRRGWPYTPLAAITFFAVLVGTIGGLGAVFNHVVSPQVRCYNRIAVYVAFLSLFAVLYALDRFAERAAAWLTVRYGRWAAVLGGTFLWGGVCWFGVWDQTPYDWAGPTSADRTLKHQARFRLDRAFFTAIESALNPDGTTPGPMVFQLPYVRWPEAAPTLQLPAYDHARGYVHTRTVRWSFGCMKGRETDEWYRRVASLPGPGGGGAVEQMLERVCRAGFDGLLLDRRGYSPRAADALQARLMQVLGSGARVIAHPDRKQIFFDLRPYRDAIRHGKHWEAEQWHELHPVQTLWLDGFTSFKDPGDEWLERWCGPKGLLLFVNPTDEPRTVRTVFSIRTRSKDPAELRIRGGDVWPDEDLTIDKNSPLLDRTFVIPPGRHEVRFDITMPPKHVPTEPRRWSFFICGFRID